MIRNSVYRPEHNAKERLENIRQAVLIKLAETRAQKGAHSGHVGGVFRRDAGAVFGRMPAAAV